MWEQRKIILAFGLVIIVLVINALVSYRATRTLIDNERLVAHSHEVLKLFALTLSDLQEAETAQRGYLITQDEKYLEPYQGAVSNFYSESQQLEELIADNPNQQRRVVQIKKLAADRLELLQEAIRLQREGQPQATRALLIGGRGKKLMDEIRRLVDAGEAEENALLSSRAAETKTSGQRALITFISVNLLAFTFAGLAIFLSQRELETRERAQAALKESEERYRTITETASDAIITIDEANQIIFANRAAQKVFGYAVEELEGQSLTILMPDYLRSVREVGLKQISGESLEVTGRHRNGQEIPLEVSFGEFSRGRRRYFTSVVRDITERKQAAEKLAERVHLASLEAEVGLALTQSDDLKEMINRCADCVIQYLDAALARIWLLNAEQQVLELKASAGMSNRLDGSQARIPLGQSRIGLIAQAREPYLTNELHTDSPDQVWATQERMLAFAGYPLIVENRVIGVIAIFARHPLSDVTLRAMASVVNGMALGIQRKQSEEALRASEEKFRTLADNMSQFAWMADERGQMFWYNQRWFDYTGTTLEDMQGRGWKKVHHPEHVERVETSLQHALETGEPWEDTFPLLGKDGKYRWFLSHARPIRDDSGRIQCWFGTNTDIDELRQTREELRAARDELERRVGERTRELAAANTGLAEEIRQRIQIEKELQTLNQELERSNRELQDFAFVASHDLQEPLRKIQAFGDLLKNDFADALGSEGRDFVERMQHAARRMNTLIQDLLTFSRVTTKAQPFMPVDLTGVAREVISDLETRIKQTGGQVEIGQLPEIEADPLQMRQLLQNLIANALKFHRPDAAPVVKLDSYRLTSGHGNNNHNGHDGQARVQLDESNHFYQITVADNGIGFEEKYLDRIFTPFQRLHTRGEYEGTGMGLAVCRKIVERHGGTITAKSQPGVGTTFLITLPVTHSEGANNA